MAEALLEQLVARSEQHDARMQQQAAQMLQLMEHLKNPAPVSLVPAAPNVDNITKEKAG